MKLIVGLGNPGKKYEKTRHNMGFMALDALADFLSVDIDKEDFKGLYVRTKYKGEDLILFKPQTFMNLSGEAVVQIMNFFKIESDDVLIIFDDLALNPGQIRLRLDGSSGGQKGMQNIIELVGTNKLKRLRIGIGEPKFNNIDYVLGQITSEEAPLINTALENCVNAVKAYLQKDFHYAMSIYNKKESKI